MGAWLMHTTLSRWETPSRAEVSAGGLLSAVELFRQRTMQDVEHERALTGPADARQDGERPQRKADVDPLEVVGARATDGEGMPVSSTALGTAGDFTLAEEVLRGEAAALDELVGALSGDASTVATRSGADLDEVVGAKHRLAVVLHDEHGIALVSERLEGPEEPV